jgi:cytochrome P450
MDPPKHTAYRTLLKTVFAVRPVEQLEPQIREIARKLIDDALAKGTFDLIDDIAAPFPFQVISELLRVPPEHQKKLVEWSLTMLGMEDPSARPENFDPLKSFQERATFFGELAEQRMSEPEEDLIGALATAELDGRRLESVECTAFLSSLLVARDRGDTKQLRRRNARDDRAPRPVRATPRRSLPGPLRGGGVRALGHADHALPADRHARHRDTRRTGPIR